MFLPNKHRQFFSRLNVLTHLGEVKDNTSYLKRLIVFSGNPNAGGRTRTDMGSEPRQILSLVRIPISPHRPVGDDL